MALDEKLGMNEPTAEHKELAGKLLVLMEVQASSDRQEMLTDAIRAAEMRGAEEYKSLLLKFIASLTLADHLGDVANDAETVLKRLGLDLHWNDWCELGKELGKMGVTTLHGTQLIHDEDEGDE